MNTIFSRIKDRISEYRKEDLLEFCYYLLDDQKDNRPIWFIFSLMKWTFLYAEKKIPSKELTQKDIEDIFKLIENLNDAPLLKFLNDKMVDKAFLSMFSQQFYLQKTVNFEKFATQLKLFVTLPGKYDINKSFKLKTGLSIFDFIVLTQFTWLYFIYKNPDKTKRFDGYILDDYFQYSKYLINSEDYIKFLELLAFDTKAANEKIVNYNNQSKIEELQTIEMTFFTMLPFHVYNGKYRLIHMSIINYAANYYIYDFLKANDSEFTTAFGKRFENYIELGIKEINYRFKNESQLKKMLPPQSKVVDFLLEDDNIFIECKAIELQSSPSINPTDELLFSSLKDSLLKAYFEQLLSIARKLNPDKENWSIIITYKEFFWCDFSEIYKLGKGKYASYDDIEFLLPENVFIMDVHTWDLLIQIVKDRKATMIQILKSIKLSNLKPETKKQLFRMHLINYNNEQFNLNYLNNELQQIKKRYFSQKMN